MIQQTFRVANESCEMLQCKQESLISDIATDKKLNAAVDKTVNANKRWKIAADKKLNVADDKTVNADKK